MPGCRRDASNRMEGSGCKQLFMGLALTLGLVLSGCGDKPAVESESVRAKGKRGEPSVASPAPTATPAPVPAVDPNPTAPSAPPSSEAAGQIQSVTGIIDLFLLEKELIAEEGVLTPDLKTTLEARKKDLMPPPEKIKALNKSVSLAAIDFRLLPNEKARASFLFKSVQDVTSEYVIHLHGMVDQAYQWMLSKDRRKIGFENWQTGIQPKSTRWKAGELHLVSWEFSAKPIPYNLTLNLIDKKTKVNSKLKMGWFVGSTK